MGTAVQDWHRRVWRPFFEKQPLPKGRCLDTASAALSPAKARLGRQRARRRAPLEGVRAPKRRSTSSLWVRKVFFFIVAILHDVKAKISLENNFSKWTSCEVCSRGPWEGLHEMDLMDFISKIIGFQQIYHEVSFQMLVSRENLVLWWQISCHFQELKIRKSSYIYSKNTLVSIECFCH